MRILLLLLLIIAGTYGYYRYSAGTERLDYKAPTELTNTTDISPDTSPADTDSPLRNPPSSYLIDLPTHYYQTFNNCGPATLSMVLNYNDINVNQTQMGRELRPYQNQQGDNDDKSVSLSEMAAAAEKRGLKAYHLPNGNIELLKDFTSHDIPVIVETWLLPNDDVGHYRVVTGYTGVTDQIIQDDSYQGPDKYYKYQDFMELWQGFNYVFLVAVPDEKIEVTEQIIKKHFKGENPWQLALDRALKEEEPANPYPIFNQTMSYYYLGDYEKTITTYEKVANQLPRTMLWYQTEPILAYKQLKNYDKALNIIDNILNGGNRAASELYKIRGDIYKEQGRAEDAQKEYELAKYYNESLY